MRALLLFASKQWNVLTERWTLLGTLHRDSLTWRPSLHLWNSLNVSDQPNWSRLSFQNEENCDTTLNSWLEPRWCSQLTVPLSDTVHPRCPQFYLLCRTLYYRLFLSLLQPQCGLLTQSFSDCTWVFKSVDPLASSRDFSDVPISLFRANIHLQLRV